MTPEAAVHLMMLRLPEAIALLRDQAELALAAEVAVAFGKHRAARMLRDHLAPAAYEAFLRDRACAGVTIGGDAQRGFWVDERAIAEIAAELGEPVPALLSRTTRAMLRGGSRHIAKLHVFARLSGDEELIAEVTPPFHARAAHPRRDLARLLGATRVLQDPDGDDYNPKSAGLFEAAGGTILKESLALHLDPTRFDGYGDEPGMLARAQHPHVVALRGVVRVHHHELMLLSRAAGTEPRGPMALQDVLRLGAQLAAVLAVLHERNLAYLDLKSRNVLWDGAQATLLDFGMARDASREPLWTVHSTAECVAPETAVAFRASRATDLFHLGLLLHHLATGGHAFTTRAPERPREQELRHYALANLTAQPRLHEAPEPLRPLLAALLAKPPADRPTAREAHHTLESLS